MWRRSSSRIRASMYTCARRLCSESARDGAATLCPMRLPPARTRFLVAALLPILVATLWPFPGQEPEGFLSCIACSDDATSDVLLNILLFAPLGAALALRVRSIPRCALIAALLCQHRAGAALHPRPGLEPRRPVVQHARWCARCRPDAHRRALAAAVSGACRATIPRGCSRRGGRVLGYGRAAHSRLPRCALLWPVDAEPRTSGAVPRPGARRDAVRAADHARTDPGLPPGARAARLETGVLVARPSRRRAPYTGAGTVVRHLRRSRARDRAARSRPR